MSDLITISSSVVPESARVVGFRGTETMSRPYEIEIFLALRHEVGEEFDLNDAIGAKARLVLDRANDKLPPFTFAGIFANIEILHAYEGSLLLRALLVPRLWQLGLSRHSRIFTKMKVPDIIKSVLEENGVTDYELRLGSYDVEEHVCQYRESDLDFISRWMEREGIFYFFEHGDAGETLVLADHSVHDADPVGKPVRYFPQLGQDHSAGASFRAFTCTHHTLPASVRLKDYDYVKPSLNVSGSAKVASNGTGEVSLYGERFFTPSAGDKLARTRSEELLTRQVVFHGTGTRLHLRPGYAFEIEEHPFASFNTRYLTIETHHSGNQAAGLAHFRELTGIEHSDVYQVEVDAIPAKTQYRAQSLTAWPRIYGYENGIVDGPADSEYAQIDEHGRYNAKFKFDESKLKGGKATTWVRMMQPHGGDIEGFHFPLRKATEVVFSFLGGDPDRPVISGVVPNTVNPSPITSANHTKNVIQTGGRNRLELEDKAGQQRVTMSTPYSNTYLLMGAPSAGHELILNTSSNALFDIGVNQDIVVKGTLTETVTGAVTEAYHSTVTQTIDGHNTIKVKSGRTETVDAGYDQTVTAFMTQTITGPATQTITGPTTQTITGPTAQTITGPTTQTITGPYTQTFVGPLSTSVTGPVTFTVAGGGVVWDIAEKVEITCDEWKVTQKGDVSWSNIGNFTHKKWANTLEYVLGTTTAVKVGLKTEVMLGGSIDTTIGAKAELFAGLKGSIFIGAHSELDLGFNLKTTVDRTEEHLLKMEMALTKMEESLTELKEKPVTITNIGIMIIA